MKNLSKRINFIGQTLLILTLVAAGYILLSSGSKKQQKVYRVGIVSGAEAFVDIATGLKAKMATLGYVEGINIIYDIRKLNADPAGVERAINEFVEDKVDLIFAFPTEPAVAAKTATKGTNIPVVFALAGLEGNNLVESILKPGGNITGVRFPGPEITAKRLEILRELVPGAKRVYLIYDPHYPNTSSSLDNLYKTAPKLEMTLVEDTVNNIKELQDTLKKRSALKDIGVDAIFIMPEILTQSPDCFEIIIGFADEHNIPVAGGMPYTTKNGALFNLAPDNIEMGKLSAMLVDEIFKGKPAGTLMVITPQPSLWLNYNVAQRMGLDIPEGLLSGADTIIH